MRKNHQKKEVFSFFSNNTTKYSNDTPLLKPYDNEQEALLREIKEKYLPMKKNEDDIKADKYDPNLWEKVTQKDKNKFFYLENRYQGLLKERIDRSNELTQRQSKESGNSIIQTIGQTVNKFFSNSR
jgi:hypothetical protein